MNDKTHRYLKKLVFIIVTIYIFLSLFYGSYELLHMFASFLFESRNGDYGTSFGATISGLVSALAIYFMYQGYRFLQGGNWSFMRLPGSYTAEVIDRDDLINELEREFNILGKLDNEIKSGNKNEDKLRKLRKEVAEVLRIVEKRSKAGDV